MRFVAPARTQVAPERFAHPVFDGYRRHLDLLAGPDWPTLATLDQRMVAVDPGIRFVRQGAGLLADGRHYEQRIAEDGAVATRPDNWHDLLNALVWIEHAPLKRALNARQVADIAVHGPRERSRGQYALTHFDEAGVVVALDDPDLLAAWDRHDWPALMAGRDALWHGPARPLVFGHALLEHALHPWPWLVAKALVVVADRPIASQLAALAHAIENDDALTDPLQLRPLPLAGLPGWHPDAAQPDFHRQAPCFQPVRPGRHYPPPLSLSC
jgi:hypothetical protein